MKAAGVMMYPGNLSLPRAEHPAVVSKKPSLGPMLGKNVINVYMFFRKHIRYLENEYLVLDFVSCHDSYDIWCERNKHNKPLFSWYLGMFIHTHMLHVWNIYQHLPYKWPKCR